MATDRNAHINVQTTPSVNAPAPSYGVVGDRVWASETRYAEGAQWYHVGFPARKVSGWVRGDLINVPN